MLVGTPIWLGEKSSVCTRLIERRFTIPPQADAAWLGEAGPGLSYENPEHR